MTEPLDLVIRGGTVATASAEFKADIGIRDGRIVTLAVELPRAKDEIDATGKLVLPGGVDAHCHFDQPTSDGSRMADDFASGPLSAAFGGTTTVIPFACQQKGQSLRAAVSDYHERANGKSVIDYAFHLIVTDPTEQVLGQELPALIRDGYSSFKIYTTYDDLKLDDRQIIEVLALAKREGALTMIHAENSDIIAWLTEALERAGDTAPRFHATARPAIAEREATHRAISLAEVVDTPILVVHVSGGEAMQQIVTARHRGTRVFAETCPQYLFLTADDLDLGGFEGAKHICSPPPRDTASQESVWRGLQDGTFQVFSSDHAPFRFDDPEGKKVGGETSGFSHVPNGIPGVETRLPLLFSEGVVKGRISLRRFVELTSTNPARLYGLMPRKGTIAIGSDADIAIWDPQKQVTITNDMLHHNVDYTPYEGRQVTGWPEIVLSRGAVVIRDGECLGNPGRGQFLECGTPDTLP
ncbi:dihydropyrimidinase [Paracoccus methylarcula]|uniref:Dihydropyrimidinase n=1 Tax=Paracoccus methylarcula TaxID=72022 RepID=A0A422QWP5_9RHOB|nr:dihydropyrimidinase [Paracoccus methylarcula]RNF34351.1 dihydropyrimidinase [Paracoccus methylarcula]